MNVNVNLEEVNEMAEEVIEAAKTGFDWKKAGKYTVVALAVTGGATLGYKYVVKPGITWAKNKFGKKVANEEAIETSSDNADE